MSYSIVERMWELPRFILPGDIPMLVFFASSRMIGILNCSNAIQRPSRALSRSCGALVGHARKLVHLTTGRPAWGNFVTDSEIGLEVPAFTVEQILDDNRLSQVDLLKVDIEGAEKEVFANGEFLPRVGYIIIELHNDYGFDDFSKDVARWRFRAVAPEGAHGVKMITASPVQEHQTASERRLVWKSQCIF